MCQQPTFRPREVFLLTDRAILFANGEYRRLPALRRLVCPSDYCIAVDGGLRGLRHLGLLPRLLVGDLDSVTPEELAAVQQAGCEVRRFPVEKDETDLELALGIAVEMGFTSLRILGALGGRLDQLLGNLFLLAHPSWQALDVRLLDAGLEAFIIRKEAFIEGRAGDTLSLLPLNGPARGIHTESLAFPLIGETLWPDRTRGISNRMLGSRARVSLADGLLLCIHNGKIGG